MLCPTTDRLKAFYLGQLPDEQSDELVSHVGTCSTCQAELETGLNVDDSLIFHLREPDGDSELDSEPACKAGLLRALGALATANEKPLNGESTAAKEPSETGEASLPKSIGEYEILKSLGHGGMGHVYLARHNKLGRMVALKILARHRLGDHRASQRFESEMRVIGRLSHPNIVIAHDAREIDGTAVLVTEYIDGFDLGQLLQLSGPMEIANACEIVRQIAMALQYTSDQGFVHRDIKPSNIMVSDTGEVKLLDLGLARLQFGDMESAEITGTGQTMGTADYISPEQVTDSRKVDIRSDLYSLGATLYKLLSGQAPFAGPEYSTAFAKMTAHVSATPGKLRSLRSEVPVELERLVATMLSKRPEDRPKRPDAVASTLSSFSKGCDLKSMVHRAASVPLTPLISEKQGTANALTQPSAEPQTQPFFHRPVQLYKAIAAGFFGAVVGLCLGILITITHPDGTKTTITVPDGSKIAIEESGKPAIPTVEPNPKTLGQIEKPKLGTTPPLQFALMLNQITSAGRPSIPSISDKELEKLISHQRANSGAVVQSGNAKFVRIDKEIAGVVPVSLWDNDIPLALVSTDPKYSISWDEIKGHILEIDSTQSEGDKGESLHLKLDKSLGAKMKSVSTEGIGSHLAIIVDDVVVKAPKIVSIMGTDVQISGQFSASQMQKMREHFLPSQRAMPSSKENSASSPATQKVTKNPTKKDALADGKEIVSIKVKIIEVDLIKLREMGISFEDGKVVKEANAIQKSSNFEIPQLAEVGEASFNRLIDSLVRNDAAKIISEPNVATGDGLPVRFEVVASKSNLNIQVIPAVKGESATVDFEIKQNSRWNVIEPEPDSVFPSKHRSFSTEVQLEKLYAMNLGLAGTMEPSKQMDSNLIVVVRFDRLPVPFVLPAQVKKSVVTPEMDRQAAMEALIGCMTGNRVSLSDGIKLDQLVSKLASSLAIPSDNLPNLKNAIRAARPFKGILSVHPGLIGNDSNWIRKNGETAFTIKVSPKDLFSDVCSFVTGWNSDRSIVEAILDGIANDPKGPKVNVDLEILPLIGDEITVLASSSLIAVRLKPGMGGDMLNLLKRAEEIDANSIRIVSDFLLFGTKDDLDAAMDRYKQSKM